MVDQIAGHVLLAPGLRAVLLLPAPRVVPAKTPASLLHPAQPSVSVPRARAVWAARHVRWGPIPLVAPMQTASLVEPSKQLLVRVLKVFNLVVREDYGEA
jgi:hypothetical protein